MVGCQIDHVPSRQARVEEIVMQDPEGFSELHFGIRRDREIRACSGYPREEYEVTCIEPQREMPVAWVARKLWRDNNFVQS